MGLIHNPKMMHYLQSYKCHFHVYDDVNCICLLWNELIKWTLYSVLIAYHFHDIESISFECSVVWTQCHKLKTYTVTILIFVLSIYSYIYLFIFTCSQTFHSYIILGVYCVKTDQVWFGAWISNYIDISLWWVIIHPCSDFDGSCWS